MIKKLSRRALLSGVGGVIATSAMADAPNRSLRPVARPETSITGPVARQDTGDMIAASGLGGKVGFVIADAMTGEVLNAVSPDTAMPPASVTKAVTALYAMEALGPSFRFDTRVLSNGRLADGVLDGDLILAGSGDPDLVTDDLAVLVAALRDLGVRQIKGRFLAWGGALPGVEEIDDTQLDYLGYNPSVGGLNLNFNRVHFEWKRGAGGYTVTMDAPSEALRPQVTTIRMQIVDRAVPVFAYAQDAGVELWSVAKGALGGDGSRWLPVRLPTLYVADVFRSLAATEGLALPVADELIQPPDQETLVTYQSEPLAVKLRDMLKYSTNITAEASGMTATRALTGQPRGLRTSALGMTQWAARRADISPVFADHSGLSDASAISPGDMVRLLAADGVIDTLRPLMKQIVMTNDARENLPNFEGEVRAKTGTLNFVSTLAGYLRTGQGRDLAFAIFAADGDARARGKAAGDEQPPGAVDFNGKAKRLQQRILQRWALLGGD